MTTLSIRAPVADFIKDRPTRARLFERLGIDYCCGGKRPLQDACAERNLDAQAVLQDLLSDAFEPSGDSEVDWTGRPLVELADHIVDTHHGFLRRGLPWIAGLLKKVTARHGAGHPELHRLQAVFDAFAAEIASHMVKEEQILFPAIGELEGAGPIAPASFSIRGPVAVMEHEHEDAAGALREMREITGDFTPPPNACNSYRALFGALAGLEADMGRHVHKENNILFPRAMELEARVNGR